MGEISVGPAVSAGFRLIGREPLAFIVWWLAYFTFASVITVATWSQTSAYYAAVADGDTSATPPFGLAQLLAFVVTFVLAALMTGAAMRAVLNPEDRRFFFLRLGARELWLCLCWVILFLLWVVIYVAGLLTMSVGIGAAGVGAEGSTDGAMFVGILILIVFPFLLWLWIWIWSRFSMAPIMTFAENRLRVWDSWRFTKGHALRIFLVALVLFVVTMLTILLALGSGVVAVVGSLTAASFDTFFSTIWQGSIAGQLIYNAVVGLVFVAMTVLGAASWAEMYRQLRPSSVADAFN